MNRWTQPIQWMQVKIDELEARIQSLENRTDEKAPHQGNEYIELLDKISDLEARKADRRGRKPTVRSIAG